jgi:hypothetical protein
LGCPPSAGNTRTMRTSPRHADRPMTKSLPEGHGQNDPFVSPTTGRLSGMPLRGCPA